MTDIQRIQVGARYSECSSYGGIIFLAGQVPSARAGGDIKAQTLDVLQQIDALLAEAGSDKSRILMAQIFLGDMKDYDGMNEVWDSWVVAGAAPPRATTQAALARAEWKIEIVVTAARS